MENETTGMPEVPGPKKKSKMKTTTWMMISAIVILSGYYMAMGYKKHQQQQSQSSDSTIIAHRDSLKQSGSKITSADSLPDVTYLMGKFNPAKEISFAEIAIPYGNREGLYVREETYAAYINMYNAALKEGVKLSVISATRSFEAQKGIWEAKWTGKRMVDGKNLATAVSDPVERARIILKYSSMPGTSRHHWGTDVDLNSMDPKYFETAAGKKIYDWLTSHASEYGFGQPYTAKGEQRPTGYEEEKWHWSYLPIARRCTEAWKEKVAYADIKGFAGAETAEKLKVIDDYVLGINPACK